MVHLFSEYGIEASLRGPNGERNHPLVEGVTPTAGPARGVVPATKGGWLAGLVATTLRLNASLERSASMSSHHHLSAGVGTARERSSTMGWEYLLMRHRRSLAI